MFRMNEAPTRIATILGTFNSLHWEQKEYIQIAFEYAKRVLIYVASDEYAAKKLYTMHSYPRVKGWWTRAIILKKLYTMHSYQHRVEQLKRSILEITGQTNYDIRCLNNDDDLRTDYLNDDELCTASCIAIVSPSYYDFFKRINEERVVHKKSRPRKPNFLILVKPETYERYQKGDPIATIGGTFNKLHRGHKEYIKLAFDYAKNVLIYVNSDEYAVKNKEHHPISFYKKRENELKEYIERHLEENRLERSYEIKCLNNKQELEADFLHGANLRKRISMVIVIPEYYETFSEINKLRQISGSKNFLILVKQRTLLGRYDMSSTIANDQYNSSVSIAD